MSQPPRLFGRGGRLRFDMGVVSTRVRALGSLRERLIRRAAGDAAAVDAFLERRIGDSLEVFVRDGYLAVQHATLDRIAALRDRLASVYERVGQGDSAPDVAAVRRDLEALVGALDELLSPAEHARRETPVLAVDAGASPPARTAPPPDLQLDPARSALRQHVETLPAATRALVERATAMDPEGARRVVSSEDVATRETRFAEFARTLRRAGLSDAEVMAVDAALRDAWTRRSEATRDASGVDATRDAATRALLARVGDPAFAAATAGAPEFFRRWAHEAPDTLAALWELYRRSGSEATFRHYVENIIARRHYRGMAGEYAAAFLLGTDFVVLKGPDQNVTVPGTDMVAVNRRTGEVLLLDNKAVRDALVGSVPALTENLPQNLADDLRSFGDQIGIRPEHDLAVNGALARLDLALGGVRDWLATHPGADLADPATQRALGDILAAQNIRRGVTGEGGAATGVTAGLAQRRIDFVSLPPAPPPPTTGLVTPAGNPL